MLKAGQQVALLFSKEVTGTVSAVRGGRVFVTWNHDRPGVLRVRQDYPADVAARILVRPYKIAS